MEFIFGRYLPLDNSNHHPNGDPPPPPRGGYGAPKFWVIWEYIGQLLLIAIKFGTKMSLDKRTMVAKFGHDRPPDGGVMGV